MYDEHVALLYTGGFLPFNSLQEVEYMKNLKRNS